MPSRVWLVVGALLLSILVTVEGGYYVTSTPTGRSIDDIIEESWNRIVSSGKLNTINEPQSRNDKRDNPSHTHNHGECASEKWLQEKTKNLKSVDLPRTPLPDPATKQASAHKRTAQPMRFYVDDSVLRSGQDPAACYSQFQVINIDGNPNKIYTCSSSDLLTDDLLSLITDSIIPTTLQIFSEVLSVKASEVVNPLALDLLVYYQYSQQCDYGIPINYSYVNPGVPNADYILFVTSRPSDNPNTVAYAGACNYHTYMNGLHSRPFAGFLNLIPRWFQTYTTSMSLYQYKKALKIAIHEATHALGFSSFFYDSFLNSTTAYFYTQSIWFQSTATGVAPSGQAYNQTITKLRGPNLLRFARDYFNCNTLDGVELEDYGGTGTAGSHWERRVCGEEYMTGFVNDQMWMSGFTLSLFDDMGWYDVDRSKVEYIGWGKDQGCGFVQSRCETSWPGSNPGYWCNTTSITGCTADRVGYGTCSLYSVSIGAYYQHFPDPAAGGGDVAADYCPYTPPTVSCRDTGRTAQSNLFEVYGDTSRCWEVNNGTTSLTCYPYQCISNNTVLQVQIGATWVTCPTNGGTVSVSAILGGSTTVNCPTTSLLCRVVDDFQPQVLITDTILLATPSRSTTPSPSRTPSVTPSISVSSSVTPSASRTPSVTPSNTPSASVTPTTSATPSVTGTPTPSVSPSVTPSSSPLPPGTTSSNTGDVHNDDGSGGGFTLHSPAFAATITVIAVLFAAAIAGVVYWGIRRSRQKKAEDIDLPTLWKALE